MYLAVSDSFYYIYNVFIVPCFFVFKLLEYKSKKRRKVTKLW